MQATKTELEEKVKTLSENSEKATADLNVVQSERDELSNKLKEATEGAEKSGAEVKALQEKLDIATGAATVRHPPPKHVF